MVYRHYQTQKREYFFAMDCMCSKPLNIHYPIIEGQKKSKFIFPKGNVTDSDLKIFEMAFNGYGANRRSPVIQMNLNGSPVSEEAMARFRKKVPQCELVP
ncbi:hypothetical protein [Polystyrenella longa]|nr:hypothetical protein [Polystyrenella longa]